MIVSIQHIILFDVCIFYVKQGKMFGLNRYLCIEGNDLFFTESNLQIH